MINVINNITEQERELQTFKQMLINFHKEIKEGTKIEDIQQEYDKTFKNYKTTTEKILKDLTEKYDNYMDEEKEEKEEIEQKIIDIETQYTEILKEGVLLAVLTEEEKIRIMDEFSNRNNFSLNVLQNNVKEVTTTSEILEWTPTKNKIITIIETNLNEFKDFALKNNINIEGSDKAEIAKEIVDKIFKRINVSIKTFLYGKFNKEKGRINPTIDNVITPAIEIYLLEFLKDNGNTNNISWLTGITEMSRESITKALSGLGNFAEKATGMYNKWAWILNAIDFLETKSYLLDNPTRYEILQNPLKCKEFLENTIWETKDLNIATIKLSDVGIVPKDEEVPFWLTSADEEKIKEDIGNIQVVDNASTVKLLTKVVDKAEEFFNKQGELREGAYGLMDMTNGVESVFRMIGVDIFWEIENSKVIKGVLDFFFSILWFTGGFDGLKKSRYRKKIEGQLTGSKRQQIKDIYKYLKEDTTEDDPNQYLSATDDKVKKLPEAQKSHFDIDGTKIAMAMEEKMDIENINPLVIEKINTDAFKGKEYIIEEKDDKGNKRKVINAEKKQEILANKSDFISAYVSYITDSLVSSDKFIPKLTFLDDPKGTVAFTIISSLYINKDNVIDGIAADVFFPESFLDDTYKQTNEQFTPSWENIEDENLTADENLAKYALDITIMLESWGNYGSVNKNDVDGVSIGLLQRHKTRAVDMLKKLQQVDEGYFNSIMTDPLFQNLDNAGNVAWNDIQAEQFKKLMEKETLQKIMKKNAIDDFRGYIVSLRGLWISNNTALIMLSRMRNAGPSRCEKEIINKLTNKNDPDEILQVYTDSKYNKKHPQTEKYAQLRIDADKYNLA